MADVKETEVKTMLINLSVPFHTNGVHYGPQCDYSRCQGPFKNEVEVEESIARDLIARQSHYDKVEKFRLENKDYTVKEALATFDAAGK